MSIEDVRVKKHDEVEKFKRQHRTKIINDNFKNCKLLIAETGEIIRNSPHPVDKKIFRYINGLATIVASLIDESGLSDERANRHEDVLQQIKQQMEELKKRLPVDDGK